MKKVTVAALLLITALAYANSVPGAYHFDDYPLILENERVAGSEFDYSSFLEQYGGRPLTFWSFWLNHQMSGSNPAVYHWISLFLHLSVVILLFSLLHKWRKNLFFAFLSALLFAIHPVQTQAVNYIWSRSMLLMAVFTLLSLVFVRRFPWVSLLMLQLAIWSRFEAVVVVIPLALMNSRKTPWYISLAVINFGFFLAGVYFYQPGEFAWYHSEPYQYWLNSFAAIWWYFAHFSWPAGFSIYRGTFSIDLYLVLASIIALASLLFLLWRYRKIAPIPVTAISWTVLFLVPSLLVPNMEIINESRSYLAFAGFACFLAWITEAVIEKLKRIRLSSFSFDQQILRITFIALILIAFLPTTFRRNQIWQDDILLWKEAIPVNPGHFHPYYNLGSAFARKGNLVSAEEAFRKSSQLNPSDDMSYAGLGYCCEMSHNWTCAAKWYSTALSLNPKNHYAAQGYTRVSHKIESKGS